MAVKAEKTRLMANKSSQQTSQLRGTFWNRETALKGSNHLAAIIRTSDALSRNAPDKDCTHQNEDNMENQLSGPPSGQGTDGGARTRDRRVLAELRADSLATMPQWRQEDKQTEKCRLITFKRGQGNHLQKRRNAIRTDGADCCTARPGDCTKTPVWLSNPKQDTRLEDEEEKEEEKEEEEDEEEEKKE
ncbi:hypothetical protein PoB_004860500 [Plakobranchus ocellatus]|uniref:Uncharacterized protein n=1 Tax=Plakobranchus ocellatus TaxID=259542 RepID=A0AAV4BS44_9GAST|nr:hypothetical protein PoB_004860500 [Plakobranchus ocellatus]